MSPLAGSRARPAVWRAALALATFVTGLFLIPIESDGALVSDGIWYGIEMESSPAKAVHGNHPLFHLIAWPLAAAARAAGFTHPGHVAYRIVAAAGGAILVSIVAAFGGRRAAWFGLAAAGYVAASRMSVIESATSENVGPATAAALAAAWAALHRRRRPVVAGALLALAMTLRQDNILLVPGIAMTLFPRGRRRGPLVAFLAATAVPVLAVYVLAWRIADPDASFLHYLLGLGTIGAYAPAASGTSFATLEAVALSDAFIGRHATGAAAESLLGLAVLLLPIALAWTRTGFRRMTREAWLFGSPVLLRFFFYGWYEPANPEWQFLAIAFSCAAAARLARLARPALAGAVRAGLLVAAACGILAAHLPQTLSLRSTDCRDAILDAVARAPAGTVVVVEGWGVNAMPSLLGLRFETLRGSDATVMSGLATILAAHPSQPILVITDRFLRGSSSLTAPGLDVALAGRRMTEMRWKGVISGVLIE